MVGLTLTKNNKKLRECNKVLMVVNLASVKREREMRGMELVNARVTRSRDNKAKREIERCKRE